MSGNTVSFSAKSWCLLLITSLISPALTQAESAAETKLTLETIEGRISAGTLEEFTESRIKIAGQTPQDIPVDEMIRIDWPARRAAGLGGQNLILLANGDRLVADALRSDDEVLTARWKYFPGLEVFSIPLEMVQAVAWRLPQDRVSRVRLLTGLHDYAEKTDRLILRNGNSLTGEFLEFHSKNLRWQSPAGPRDIGQQTLRSLAFNPELIDFPEPKGLRLIVSTIDGSRFVARKFAYKPDAGMELTTAFGATVVLALDRILSMQVVGGRAVYLSDLRPQQYTFTPYLSLSWPLRTDRNVSGHSLRLGGREYAKGLGTHSRSEISYSLNGDYRQFQATVGIDDHARGGNAVVEVHVDGKPVFTSEPLTGAAPPIRLRPIDTTNAQTLTLIVKFAERGDVRDHVNWCDALLVK